MNSCKELRIEYEPVQVCSGCLATDCKFFDIRQKQLEQAFANLTGLVVSSCLLCSVCLQLLRKFSEFRTRCLNTFLTLQQLNPLNQKILTKIDRTHLKYNLGKTRILLFNCDSAEEQNKHESCVLGNTDTLVFTDSIKSSPFYIPDIKSDPDENNLTNDTEYVSVESTDLRNIAPKKEIVTTTPCKPLDTKVKKVKNKKNEIKASTTPCKPLDTKIKKVKNKKGESKVSKYFSAESSDESSNEENVFEIEKETKNSDNKKESEEKSSTIISKISKLFIMIRMKVGKENSGDFYSLFEKLYILSKDPPDCLLPMKKLSSKKKSLSENLICLIYLYRQLAELHNISIEFLSISEQRRAMDDRRLFATGKQCPQCCRVYRSPATLQRHISRSHQEDFPYRCVVCQYTFHRQLRYMMHMFKVHTMRKTCKECGQNIVSFNYYNHWEEVNEHIESVHRKVGFPCEYCPRTFTALKLRYMHIRSRHPTQMAAVQCLLCGPCYNGPLGLRNHIARMHKAAAHCLPCGVWFVDAPTRATHAAHGECRGKSGCPMCGATFPTEQLMKEHYDDTHAKYKCDKCILTFVELKSYKHHCSRVCGAIAPRPASDDAPTDRPKAKRKSKPLGKDYICDVCGKGFSWLALLRDHRRLHTGEKPHQCPHCPKQFRLKSTRKVHIATHTNDRAFKCGVCPKAFRQYAHLQTHMVMHTKVKKFACEQCDKRYPFQASLREHRRTVHEGLPPFPRNKHKKN